MRFALTLLLVLGTGSFASAQCCDGAKAGAAPAKVATTDACDGCEGGAKTAKVSDCDGCEGDAKAAKTVKAADGECDGCCEGEAKAGAKTAKAGACDGCEGGAKTAKASDCDGCGGAKKISLRDAAVALQGKAAKGCSDSKAKLAKLRSEVAAETDEQLLERLASLEAEGACPSLKEKTAALWAIVAPKPAAPVALSISVAKLHDAAEKGCKTSRARLDMLRTRAGAGCDESLAQMVGQLETAAAHGCGESKAKLAALQAVLEVKQAEATKPAATGKVWF